MPPRRSERKRKEPERYTDTSNIKPARSTKRRKSSSTKSSSTSGSKNVSSAGSKKSSSSTKGGSKKGGRKVSKTGWHEPTGGSKQHPMTDDQAKVGAEEDKKAGKAPSTQAGHYVHEEMERMKHPQAGVHKPVSRQQAIAIGLSKARKAGIKVGENPNK